jgi:hypothetical protein
MVGAANSDSARISFFGSTKGELAQKLDRGKDAAGCRRENHVEGTRQNDPVTSGEGVLSYLLIRKAAHTRG